MISQLFQSWNVTHYLSRFSLKIQSVVFGNNNERLDFIIDSFHKLEPREQKIAIGSGFFVMILIVIMGFTLYFYQVESLKQELITSVQALEDLNTLSVLHKREEQRFQEITRGIASKTQSLKNVKTFFENISREVEVNIGTLDEKVVPLSQGDLFANDLEEIQVEVAINNISLPKILKYVTAIEKSDNALSVVNISIRSRYETKLYFDTKISVLGYRSKQ